MMLSRFAQQALKRSLPVRTANSAAFSVLGHGKYKTSTGIVRFSSHVLYFSLKRFPNLNLCFYIPFSVSFYKVGLPVDPNACENIVVHYQALLDRMAASDMPETAQYRVVVEKIANYRIKIAKENPDDPDLVEELCRCGQVEELVEQAKDEMQVLEMYLKERVWELVPDHEVGVEYNPDPSTDHETLDDIDESEESK